MFDGAARLHVEAGRPGLRRIRRGREQFTSGAVQHVEIAILRCLHQHLPRLAVDGQFREHDVLTGGVVPGITRRRLVMPHVFTSLGLQRHDGRQVEVIATTGAPNFARPRCAVAHADVDKIELGVVHDGIPNRAATAELPPFARPRFGRSLQGRALRAIRRVGRHRVEAPQLLARSGVVSGDVATHTQLRPTVADEYLALRYAWRAGDGVTTAFRRSADAPHFFASACIHRHQTAIERTDEQLAFPSRSATVHGIAAGMHTRLPRYLRVVSPQLLAARGIKGEQLAPGSGDVHDAVDDERRRFLRAVLGIQVHAPGQAQLPNVGVIHLFQRREALFAVSAAIAHPVGSVGIGSRKACRIDGSGLHRLLGRLAGSEEASEREDKNQGGLGLEHGRKPRKRETWCSSQQRYTSGKGDTVAPATPSRLHPR